MKNPCLNCELLHEDKNGPECKNCRRRMEYVAGIGGMTSGMPVEQTNLGGGGHGRGGMTMEYQVCNDPDCAHAGERQPMSAFGLHPRHKTPMKKCKACVARRQSEGAKKRLRTKKKPGASGTGAAPDDSVFAKQGGAPSKVLDAAVVIDFSKRKEILERLRKLAEYELRSVEDQAFIMIRAGLAAAGPSGGA